MNDARYDVFVCHASEDKAAVVRPLYQALQNAGINCWLDEQQIRWGHSIVGRINEGLRLSRYVIVVASIAFASKNWPQAELETVLNQEITSGSLRVLPLLVGNDEERDTVLNTLPLLKGKRYLLWDGTYDHILSELKELLGVTRSVAVPSTQQSASMPAALSSIPLPQIRRRPTDFDKDQFLHDSFEVVRRYFDQGLTALQQYPEIKTRLEEIDSQKFICTVYLNEKQACRCKVWIGGGTLTSDSIAYATSHFDVRNDGSINECLTATMQAESYCLKPTFGMALLSGTSDKDCFTSEQAAEYLWKQFTHPLSRQR